MYELSCRCFSIITKCVCVCVEGNSYPSVISDAWMLSGTVSNIRVFGVFQTFGSPYL